MLVRQSTIDRHRLEIEQRIAQLQQRLKVKVPVPQIKTINTKNHQQIEQKYKQSPQKISKSIAQVKQQPRRNFSNNHSNNVQNKMNHTNLQKKPQQNNKYSRSFSLRDENKNDKLKQRDSKRIGQTLNFGEFNKQNVHENQHLSAIESKYNIRMKQAPKATFNYISEMSKPSQKGRNQAFSSLPDYNPKINRYIDKNSETDKLGKIQIQSHRTTQAQTQNRQNLLKMITNLLQGQKTLQQQFHRFKQMYENDVTMRVDNSYCNGKKQDEKSINFPTQQDKIEKYYDFPLQKNRVQSWKNQPQNLNRQKITHEPSFSDLTIAKYQDNNTIIKKIRQQSNEKVKPAVTFLSIQQDDSNFLQRKDRKSILKNNLNKNHDKNKTDYGKPKNTTQEYYKQARQKYLYPYLQKNQQSKTQKNKKQRANSLNITSKSVGLRKTKPDKFNQLLKLLKQQKNTGRIKVSQDVQQRLWKNVEEKYRNTINEDKQIYHKNNKFQYEHIVNTSQLQRKLRQQLLGKIYDMADGCLYK